MANNNIILTGFMGSGKTTLGLRLSYRLRLPFLDTDNLIVQKAGMSIPEIFETQGEAAFRQMETELLKELRERTGRYIISTGGGTPLREENREALKQLGTVVLFRVSPEEVWNRIGKDKNRPLLQCDDPQQRIRDLLAERTPKYEAAADLIIDVDGKEFAEVLQILEDNFS